MTENAIAHEVVDVAYRIHKDLGPGLLESVYEIILASQLAKRGIAVVRQQAIPLIYDGVEFDVGFRADLIVGRSVVVEVKAVSCLAPVHKKQLLTYLKLTKLRLGILINFDEGLIKDGICRVVNGLPD